LTGTCLVVATSPLFTELAAERLYPVPEGMVGGWLNVWYYVISILFLGLLGVPRLGIVWLNYILPLSCLAVVPLVLGLQEVYGRTDLDCDQ
jgi:hypothetical protein